MNKSTVITICCVVAISQFTALPARGANLLTNGSFETWENGTPAGWHWFKKHGSPPQHDNPTPVGIEMAEDEAYTGNRSIHFWKSSNTQGDRYGMLYQDVKNLPSGAKLHLRTMLKGKAVGSVQFGIWSSRPVGPTGDYDWREFAGTIELPKGDTEIRFMILLIGSKTDDLWLDNISLTLEGEELAPLTPSDKAHRGRIIETSYNEVANGSFETLSHVWYRDPLDPWTYQPGGDDYSRVAFTRDAGASTHGFYSMRISKRQGAPLATLEQKITGLTPGATIRYGAMLKGEGVKGASIGLGDAQTAIADGDFDWRFFTGKTRLDSDSGEATVNVRVTGMAENLWVDHVRVWPDGKLPDLGGEYLLIRRVQPSPRPGVQTIARTKPYLENQTGFEVIVRNPQHGSPARTFVLDWTLCDAFGAPMRSESDSIKLNALEQKRIMIPLTSVIKERRVVGLIATVRDELGQVLADDLDFVTSLPESLAPIKPSRRFGYNLTPYLWNTESIALYMDLAAAGGCGGFKYNHMARSYNSHTEKLDLEAWKPLFSMVRARGIEIVPILYYTPVWASSAPPDATRHLKMCSMPLLDPWREMCKQYVREHQFKIVEVWNEPNGGFWASFPKDKTYAQLLTATYEAVKEVDPQIVVLGCSTNNSEINWPQAVLKAGGKMDAISFHPYRWPQDSARGPSIEKSMGENPSYPQAIAQMNAMSAKYNHGKPLPLYVTEVGTHEVEHSGKRVHKRLHAMALYKTQYNVRTCLTLAGLGVVSTYIWQFGDAVADQNFGAAIHKDMGLKPGWWAIRTLHEVAATRQVGQLTQLSDDVFALTMTGYRNAVAVWTVQDPAIVGTTRPVYEARDLFGRSIPPITTPQGHAHVIPAGSVIYLIGDKLTTEDIQPLVRLAADKWRVPPGGTVHYDIQASTAAASYFPGGSPTRCALAFDDACMVRWGGGELSFSAGGHQIRVPAMVPVRRELGLKLRFNEQCHPEVWIENNLPEPQNADIKIRAGAKVVDAKTVIAAGAVHRQVASVLPPSFAESLHVQADVTLGGKRFNIGKTLQYAAVPKRTVQIDGDVKDWIAAERIDISKWHRWHNFGVDAGDTQDFSAKMALAYDDANFYVLVEVTDDVHSQTNSPSQSWRGDSLQVAFDPHPMGDHAPIAIDIALADDGREIIFSRPMNAIDETRVRFKIRRRDTLTIYETAVPLSAIHIEAKRGARLGFSLLVNENDGTTREGYVRWSDGIGMGTQPEKYGQLILVD